MILNKRGFTLVELLVVIAMIAVLAAAMTAAVEKTRAQARIEKARADVKAISQAILSWENYSRGGKHELKEMNDVPANSSSLDFILGTGEQAESGEVMTLLMASLHSSGELRDPWGRAYRIRIKEGNISAPDNLQLQTGYYLPNFYRLAPEERR